MNLQTRPKLYPPRALLWRGPLPYQRAQAAQQGGPRSPELSGAELRSLVSELIG